MNNCCNIEKQTEAVKNAKKILKERQKQQN
jgi:hypothetical protein